MSAISGECSVFQDDFTLLETSSWTDIKVQRVAEYTLSALSLGLGAYLATLSSVPLVLLSAAVAYHAYGLIDYQNPQILTSLRSEAASRPLGDTLQTHGWENLFRHELLTPVQLASAYRLHADTLSFKEILDLYREASQKRPTAYLIPSPKEWKERFPSETATLRCDELLELYPLKELIAFRVLSNAEERLLQKAEHLRESFSQLDRDLKQQLAQLTEPFQTPSVIYVHGSNCSSLDPFVYGVTTAFFRSLIIGPQEKKLQREIDANLAQYEAELALLNQAYRSLQTHK